MQADLDIIQLLRMQKGYRIMKQVLLNIDDLFLLKNQHLDIIDPQDSLSSDKEDENDSSKMNTINFAKDKSHQNLRRIFTDSDSKVMDESQARDLEKMLKRYEGKVINER